VTPFQAIDIAHLPKKEQHAALEAAITKPAKRSKFPKGQLTPEEAAKDAECLEYIKRPSIYPVSAFVPNDMRLREAIGWLLEHEPKIANFSSQKQCDDILRCTNAIASYRDNFFNAPRLDGELDPRILEWQQTLWRKRLRQEERIELQRKLRHRSQPKMAPIRRKVRLPFEDRFDIFWSLIESNLKTFKHFEQRRIVQAFRLKLKEFFSEISAGNNGSCPSGQIAQNSETEITAIH
jgi:hypothetical protein